MPAALGVALSIAREAHEGQSRRHGAPYIGHPVAVKELVDEIGRACGIFVDDDTRAVSLLHDVLEDCPDISVDELRARFGPEVSRRVQLLTKTGKGDEATQWYYDRLMRDADDATRLVKVCDRLHNLSELHLAADAAKLKKYVDETLRFVIPLAASVGAGVHPKRGQALVAALHDALRAACRAQNVAAPTESALPKAHVPTGMYAIVAPRDAADVEQRCRALVDGGIAMIQIRAKGRSDREVLALTEAALGVCRRAQVPVIVNDRPDLALAARAAGVHFGRDDLPPFHARRVVGASALIGTSTHTEAELADACAEGGADHVAVGPIYLSTTKSGHAPVVGVLALAARVRTSRLPVVAIGGITNAARVIECARAGARLVACVGALDVHDPRPMTRRLSLAFFAAQASAIPVEA